MKAKPRAAVTEERNYFKEVRFRQIRALVETARCGSFAEASRQLGMATPSVWRQVRALEEEYGVSLVVARGQELHLTGDGELLADLAGPIVEGFDSLRRVFADRQGKTERILRVAAPATVLNSSLREPVADYQRTHANVKLSLIDAPSRDAFTLLAEDRADLAIIGQPEGMEVPARFEAVPLARFAFQAVCLATNPFAAIRKPTLRDLLRQPLILAGEASSSRMQFDHLVARAGLADRVNICLTANNLALILNYVAIGMGVALITRPAREATPIPPELEQQLVFRDLSHILGHEQVVLLHPRGRHELSHVRSFRERVVAELG